MTTRSEEFDEYLRGLDQDTEARINERARRAAADPAHRPPEWLPDPPDPFRMGWAWAEPGQPATPELAPAPQPAPPARRRPLRLVGFTVAASVAAALLIGLGALLTHRGGEDGPLVASVALTQATPRGPGSVPDLAVENRSDRRAFVTVVGLSPNRRPAVHYREAERFIDIPGHASRTIRNLPEPFDGSAVVLIVLTGSPAGEAVRDSLPPVAPAADLDGVRTSLLAALQDLGYRGVTIEVVHPPAGR